MKALSNTDSRLTKAYELLESGKIKFLSLDIFDTLLWRKVPLPVDLFLILGQKLKKEGWLIDAITAEGFAELRVGAEQLARMKKIKNNENSIEVTLEEIYWTFSGVFRRVSVDELIAGQKGIINESDVGDLVAMEVSLERLFTEFDLNILGLVDKAKQKNIPVILMSDTYFEKKQISHILDRNTPDGTSFLKLIHTIFLSCEYGLEKKHGLYVQMLREINVQPEDILHIGDNLLSDCTAAEYAKIPSLHYCKGSDKLTEIIDMEWPESSKERYSLEKKSDNKEKRQTLLDPAQGDFGLVAMRSKLWHHRDLVRMTTEEAFYWRYGATVFGPILFGFVEWIYKRCQELGQSQVFCLLREGRLYANLIKQNASLHPELVLDTKELWGTRQYMMYTCIFKASSEELFSVFRTHPSSPYTIGTFAASLGIDVDQLGQFKKYQHVRMQDDSLIKEFIYYLSNHALLREVIIQKSFERRKRYLKYLSSIVDVSSISQMILVDIGWKGTVQGALQMILYMEGYKINVHGLYLGTVDSIYPALMQGFIKEGYLMKAGHPKYCVKSFVSGGRVLEQTAIAGKQPLIDFDQEGVPITGHLFTPQKQLKEMQLVNEGILACFEQLSRYINVEAITWNASSEALAEQLRQMLVRATSRPSRQEAIRFGSWTHDHRSGIHVSTAIGKNEYYDRFVGDIFPQMIYHNESHIVWPVAVVAKYDDYMTQAVQEVLKSELPDDCFLSHDTLPVKVFMGTEKGFSRRATRSLHLHSNVNRSFFLAESLFSLKKPISKLRIEIKTLHTLVRIKSLRLTVQNRHNPQPEEFIYFESPEEKKSQEKKYEGVHQKIDGLQELQDSQGLQELWRQEIDAGVFYSNESFTLEYHFDAVDIYAVEIKMCLETFRLGEG
jgi:predicted HAD superfamily hydrolase